MKKLILALLVLVLALSLFACGTPDETTNPDDTTVPSTGGHVHNYEVKTIVAPTCTSLGRGIKQCACGEKLSDNEVAIPFAAHQANEITCTEDSVCKICGEVLFEKYGHNFVETVVTAVTCTTDGKSATKCSRCGIAGDSIVVPSSHDYDMVALSITADDVSVPCKRCGKTISFFDGELALEIPFDSETDFKNLAVDGFSVDKKDCNPKFEGGAIQPNGALFIGYDTEFVTSMSKFILSFDFKLADQGQTHRGESIFTFLAAPNYYCFVKFFQAEGVISTVQSNFTIANSYPVVQGNWYNFTAVVDVNEKIANVYIDGTSIGTMPFPDHYSETLSNFRIRFYDIMPVNGTSNPYFDNFRLAEIK